METEYQSQVIVVRGLGPESKIEDGDECIENN